MTWPWGTVSRHIGFAAALVLALAPSPALATGKSDGDGPALPLAIGETFTIESRVLGETRRINVYRPPTDSAVVSLPVLYMPDGGIGEDFLHVAGLVQVSVGNGTMRPFLLVGIENTQRRRDLTGPTEVPEDRAIAPHVGGSAAFRDFLRSELRPLIDARYPTTGETAIMGESLAGLFVVETFFTEPELFDTYIAFDPSLWWNHRSILARPVPPAIATGPRRKSLYLANSSEPELAEVTRLLAQRLRTAAPRGLRLVYEPLPGETHATIYHPAALRAVRRLLGPPPGAR